MTSTRENYQHISRDYQVRGPHLVSYKVALTMPFYFILHFHHAKITLHKYFVITDALIYERLNPPKCS